MQVAAMAYRHQRAMGPQETMAPGEGMGASLPLAGIVSGVRLSMQLSLQFGILSRLKRSGKGNAVLECGNSFAAF